ncbi:MAG: hypothetical protein ACXADY_19805 [Candidatus Hodarchaeales archaeon]|jgi:hypothetical protein
MENTWSVIDLKKELKKKKTANKMIEILREIQPIQENGKTKAIAEIKTKSINLIEGEKDLSTLDGF